MSQPLNPRGGESATVIVSQKTDYVQRSLSHDGQLLKPPVQVER